MPDSESTCGPATDIRLRMRRTSTFQGNVPRIAPALQYVGESLTLVSLSLQSIFLEKPHPSGRVRDHATGIGKFIAARQLSERPIFIRDWDRRTWSSGRMMFDTTPSSRVSAEGCGAGSTFRRVNMSSTALAGSIFVLVHTIIEREI